MDASDVAHQLDEALRPRLTGWTIAAHRRHDDRWTITLTHPASHGLVLELRATEPDTAVTEAAATLAANTEIAIIANAPHLEHVELVLGLRGLASSFKWSYQEVCATAFMLYEHGHLTEPETAWLAGYEGRDAPMSPISPLG